VAINCAAIPKEIAESHLFGHMKGSFTGANCDQKGVFEDSDQTTLFLDEIAELSLEVQAKLLRVLDSGFIQRVGSTIPRKVDVRIIAATNKNLEYEVREGRFREDLFFRLEVLQIRLPPLRERQSEIAGLAAALLNKINLKRKVPRQLSKDALRRLEQYDWPGNVRQLTNVLERSALYSRTDILMPDDLLISDNRPAKDPLASLPEPCDGFSLDVYLTQVRKQLIMRALSLSAGNQSEAAKRLGVSRQAISKFLAGEAVSAS
jgi:transcriptional regulator with PAS, ATPase and Fis domain